MYSIKTDLGVSGNATINKDLLVNGNAVFKQDVTIEGAVTFADATFTSITSTSTETDTLDVNTTASIKDVNVSGNSTLGTDATSTISVKGQATFSEDVAVQKNITQPSSGTASLGSVTADVLTVTNETTLQGDVTAVDGTTAKFDTLETNTLSVSGASTHTGTATFGDVVINGSLTGTYTVDTGNFTNLEVTNQSQLKDLNVSGATIVSGNVTGTNSTATFNRLSLAGANANITFSYTDPARPLDIKTSVQPYRVTSNEISTNIGDIKRLSTGDSSFADAGFVGKGISTMDYLDLTGNPTLGTNRPRLEVTAGLVKLHDLEITGSVSGLTFDDGTFESITVNGISTFKGSVILENNLTGAANSTVTVNRYVSTGANGSFTFNYSDPGRPLDIRTSLTPYLVTTQEVTTNVGTVSKQLTVGTESNVTTSGLVSKGRSTFDYLDIKGNSTELSTKPKLQVAGKTILEDLEITGSVSGITFDLSGQDIDVNSLTATTEVQAETVTTGSLSVTGTSTLAGNVTVTGQTTTVTDLVVTGTTTGVTVVANVDGLDIKPNSIEGVTYIDAETATLDSLDVNGNLGIGGNITTAINAPSITTTGAVTGATVVSNGSLSGTNVISTGTATSTFAGNVIVGDNTTTTVHDLIVTGVATGIEVVANVDGLDIKPNTVEAVTSMTSPTINVTGTATANALTVTTSATSAVLNTPELHVDSIVPHNGTSVSMGDVEISDLTATTASIATLDVTTKLSTTSFATDVLVAKTPGESIEINSAVNANNDFTVYGEFFPLGGFNMGNVDLDVNSLNSTTDVNVGGNLSVTGNVTGTLKTAALTATTLGVTGATTLAGATASTLAVTGAASLNGGITSSQATVSIEKNTAITGDLDVSGTLTAGGIDLSGTAINAASLDTTGNVHVGGNLTVDGTFDLSSQDISAASLTSTGNTTVGADLLLTTGVITGAPKISGNTTIAGTLGVTGNTVLSTLTSSGLAQINSLNVSGVSTLAGLSVTSLTSTGNITMSTVGTEASFYSARVSSAGKLVVGAGAADAGVIAHIKGAAAVDGNLTVSGQINGTVNLDGQTISPLAVDAQTTINAAGNITTPTTMSAGVVVAGTTAHAAINAMQVNGNVVCNGDFEVTSPGRIIGQLDMSTSVVDVAGIKSTGLVETATLTTSGLATLASLSVTGISTFTGKATFGDVAIATLTTTGVVALNGGATIAGTTSTISSGTLTVSSPVVNFGASSVTTFAGTTEFTGAVEMEDVTITGTLNTDIADLVTESVSTKKYVVKSANRTDLSGSVIPGTLSNIENWTLSGPAVMESLVGTVVSEGEAGSWFVYVDSNGFQLNFGTGYATPLGTYSSAVGVVNVIQLVYRGTGNIIDIFITQR